MSKLKKDIEDNEVPGNVQDYLDLFESIRDGVYVSDLAGNLKSANGALCKMFGYSREDMLALNTTALYRNARDRSVFMKEIRKKGYVEDYELELVRKDGSGFTGLLNSTTRKSDNGKTEVYQGIIRDISRQRTMESEILDTEKRFQVLFDKSPHAIFVLNNRGITMNANSAAALLLGLSPNELIDKHFAEWTSKKYQKNSIRDFELMVSGALNFRDAYVKHASGKSIPVEIRASPIRYEGQLCLLQYITNISKRKLAERRLSRERQSRLKVIVNAQEEERRRISLELHDGLGQILTSVRFRVNTALRGKGLQFKMKQVEAVKVSIDEMIAEVRSMSNKLMPGILNDLGLVAALNKFAQHAQEISSAKILFNSLGLRQRLKVEAEIGIYRIVQEAVNNCLKYAKASQISIQLIRDGAILRLMIEDDGLGFNTKAVLRGKNMQTGHGNGLGNIKTRSEMLNGDLLIESSEGKGTTVTVDFPMRKLNK